MKNTLLITTIAINSIMIASILAADSAETTNILKVTQSDKSTHTYLFEKLPQTIQNHPKKTMGATGLIITAQKLLAISYLENKKRNDCENILILFIAPAMTLLGLYLFYTILNAPEIEKTNESEETTS